MLRSLLVTVGLMALVTGAHAADPQKFDAMLVSHAELPAASFTVAPENAPYYFQKSARFTSGTRVEQIYGYHDPHTGIGMPYPGQALQGFSGIRSLGNNRFVTLTDNGFGTKANSADSMLMFHYLNIDWAKGQVNPEKTVFLSDPNKVVPFPIVSETSKSRYLTGADFDIESIQPVGDDFYFGDELGPWLIQTDGNGVVKNVFKTTVAGVDYISPDNAFISVPNPGTPVKGVNHAAFGRL